MRWGWAGHDGHWYFGLWCKKNLQAVTVHLHLTHNCWRFFATFSVGIIYLSTSTGFESNWHFYLSPTSSKTYAHANLCQFLIVLWKWLNCSKNTLHKFTEIKKSDSGMCLTNQQRIFIIRINVQLQGMTNNTGNINNTGETKYLFTVYILAVPHYCIYTKTEGSLFTNSKWSTHGFESSKATKGQK